MMLQLKELIKKQPLLVKMYRSFKSGATFKPTYTKTIKGSSNTLDIDSSALLIECRITITGNHNEVVVKETAMLTNVTINIHGNNNKIVIGKNVGFSEGGSLWIEDDHCQILIGDETSFVHTSIAVTEPYSKVEIGYDCLFAYDIDVRTGDSHSIIDLATNKRINYARNVIIGNHVWVASHVSILKGVSLPSNCIVATRALVTKSFDKENVLIGGSPATILKENINWEKERIYEK